MTYFDYFQIISLIIFLMIFFVRSFWLSRKGTIVFRLGKGKKGLAALLEKSFFLFFPLWLFEIMIHSQHLNLQFLPSLLVTPLFKTPIIRIIGIMVISASLLVFGLALISFKSSWRVGIDTVTPGRLITTGIFSWSRNPIFLSMDFYFLGTFLIYGNWFFLLSFLIIALGFHLQICQEENFLMARYGDLYRGYIRKVPRYL